MQFFLILHMSSCTAGHQKLVKFLLSLCVTIFCFGSGGAHAARFGSIHATQAYVGLPLVMELSVIANEYEKSALKVMIINLMSCGNSGCLPIDEKSTHSELSIKSRWYPPSLTVWTDIPVNGAFVMFDAIIASSSESQDIAPLIESFHIPLEQFSFNFAPLKPATKLETSRELDEREVVKKAVENWTRAWSEQDVVKYLEAYASNFATPSGVSRERWENGRKVTLLKAKFIDVACKNVEVRFDPSNTDLATVVCTQIYYSSNYKSQGIKTLNFLKEYGRWKIASESMMQEHRLP